jgi:nitroreductase
MTEPVLPTSAVAFERLMGQRTSTRSFEPDPVPRGTVEAILRTASLAPSNSNTQPWGVHVLLGDARRSLARALRDACEAGLAPAFSHFPETLPPRLAAHQSDFGARYYGTLGIDRADAAAREAQTLRNYDFFDAPVGLVLTVDRTLRAHSWLDCGLFLQSLMLAARTHGLATCPQVSFARFDERIRAHLGIPDAERVVCGVSLGRPRADAAVNAMRHPRRPVADFTIWHGRD